MVDVYNGVSFFASEGFGPLCLCFMHYSHQAELLILVSGHVLTFMLA